MRLSVREKNQRWKENNPESYLRSHRKHARTQANRDAQRRYKLNHPARLTAMRRDWQVRNPEKCRAHQAVYAAVKSGKLIKQSCWCGEAKVQAHHEDYSKQLEVKWLCQKHHQELHRKYPKVPGEGL